VTLVKDLFAGEFAGYGLMHVATRDSKIAVVSIGYADGLPRALSCGVGNVLINGSVAPIIGRICMDQTIVDVTGIPNVSPGDVAVLIGKSGDEEIAACDLAEQTDTISNEILSRLGKRLERIVVS
jgi:serine/alanine racemase